jgi:hypothetical protein
MIQRPTPLRHYLAALAATTLAIIVLSACTTKTNGSTAAPDTVPTTATSAPAATTSSAATSAPTTSAPAASYPLSLDLGPTDTDACSAVAYGQVATYLGAHGCETMERSLYLTTAGGRRVLVSTAQVIFVDTNSVQPFVSLITGNGSGDIRTLLDDGGTLGTSKGLPAKFAGDPTFLAQGGATTGGVDVLEAMWLDGVTTHADDPTLTAVLTQSATTAFPTQADNGACPSAAALTLSMSTAHVAGTLSDSPMCSGVWAVAFPVDGQNEFTVVFLDVAGTWRVVDRTVPCGANQIPAAIQQAACNSN